MSSNETYHIDKIYYWDGEDIAAVFQVRDSRNELVDQFDSYTKAERKICEILERDNA